MKISLVWSLMTCTFDRWFRQLCLQYLVLATLNDHLSYHAITTCGNQSSHSRTTIPFTVLELPFKEVQLPFTVFWSIIISINALHHQNVKVCIHLVVCVYSLPVKTTIHYSLFTVVYVWQCLVSLKYSAQKKQIMEKLNGEWIFC